LKTKENVVYRWQVGMQVFKDDRKQTWPTCTSKASNLETTPPSIVNNVFTWIDSFDIVNMTEDDTIVKRDWQAITFRNNFIWL
jgi:hypothetical protein